MRTKPNWSVGGEVGDGWMIERMKSMRPHPINIIHTELEFSWNYFQSVFAWMGKIYTYLSERPQDRKHKVK